MVLTAAFLHILERLGRVYLAFVGVVLYTVCRCQDNGQGDAEKTVKKAARSWSGSGCFSLVVLPARYVPICWKNNRNLYFTQLDPGFPD